MSRKNKIIIWISIIGLVLMIIGAYIILEWHKARELSELLKEYYGRGYHDGVNSPESKYSNTKTQSRRSGITEGVEIGRRSTLNGLSNPDLSNPDQIELAVHNDIILTKLPKGEGVKKVMSAIPEKEFENYLRSKVEDSYDDTFLKP